MRRTAAGERASVNLSGGLRNPLYEVDQRVGPVCRRARRVLQVRRDVDGHEGGVEAPGLRPRIIEVAGDGGIGRVFVERVEAVGQIGVAVHPKRRLNQPVGARASTVEGDWATAAERLMKATRVRPQKRREGREVGTKQAGDCRADWERTTRAYGWDNNGGGENVATRGEGRAGVPAGW